MSRFAWLAPVAVVANMSLAGLAEASPATPLARISFVGSPTGAAGGFSVRLHIESRAPGPLRVRVFAKPTEGRPLTAGLVNEQVIPQGAATDLTIAILSGPVGDVQLTAMVAPESGGVTAAVAEFVRLGDKPQALAPAAYLALHGREVAERRPGFGLQPPSSATSQLHLDHDVTAARPQASSTPRTGLLVGGEAAPLSMVPPPAERRDRGGEERKYLTYNPLTLSGHVTTLVNGVIIPMRNTKMQVWDHDTTSPDDMLGNMTTDNDGNYNVTVDNDDGPFGGGVDVYLFISAKQSKIGQLQVVPDGEGGFFPFYYAWQSITSDDITSRNLTKDFQITDQAEAASSWSGSSRAEYLLETQGGMTPRYTEIRFPGLTPGTFFNPSAGFINIDFVNNAPEVSGHEYGHVVQYLAYGSIPGEGGTHYFCAPASVGLAWSEGFATYWGLMSGDGSGTMHWTSGDAGQSIERWSCNLTSIATDEGRVGAGLWDLWDSANDSNGGDALKGRNGPGDTNSGTQLVGAGQIATALSVRVQNSFADYWNDLRPRLRPEQQAPSDTVLTYNYNP